MLAPSLRRQLFGDAPVPAVAAAARAESQATLQQHGLAGKQGDVQPSIAFTLPPLQGRDVTEHFERIGRAVAEPYLTLAQGLAATPPPAMPAAWRIAPGWTRYSAATPGGVAVPVRLLPRPPLVSGAGC